MLGCRRVNNYDMILACELTAIPVCSQVTYSADLAIEIPGNLSQGGSWYRLDYSPPVGSPPPNTTIAATEIGDVIKFKDGLPGTRYEYWLYYSNSTLHDWLTWTASITTRTLLDIVQG